MEIALHRKIKSYVRRIGRLTSGQSQAINELEHFYISKNALPSALAELADASKSILDIGFGNGLVLSKQAIAYPQYYFFGVEVYLPGIGSLLQQLEANKITNTKVINDDAALIVNDPKMANTLDRIQLLFPDPWPKKRHHKRRLIDSQFIAKVHACLKPQGVFYVATDSEDYANQINQNVRSTNLFMTATSYANIGLHLERTETKFERKGIDKHSFIWQMTYIKR